MYQLKTVQHDFEVEVGRIGVTVRKGFKWAVVPNGTRIELWRCEVPHDGECPQIACSPQGEGMIDHRFLWVGRLRDLPARLIEYEHEERSRSYSVLLDSLARAYGTVSEDDWVTVMGYLRTVYLKSPQRVEPELVPVKKQ